MNQPYKAKAYLLSGCPFCFKFALFMTEAQLLDQIEIEIVEPQNPATEHLKSKIADSTQAKPSFPAVEIEPGVFKLDSDKLIEYYAEKNNKPTELPILTFYKDGLFTQYVKLYKENLELKKAQGTA